MKRTMTILAGAALLVSGSAFSDVLDVNDDGDSRAGHARFGCNVFRRDSLAAPVSSTVIKQQ